MRDRKPNPARERAQSIARQLGAMTPEARDSLAATLPVILTAAGAPLSGRNAMMVAMQAPGATMVAGFRQWLALGRAVRRGEHACYIWAPTRGRSADADAADGEARTGGFILVPVFDIGQTDAADGAAGMAA